MQTRIFRGTFMIGMAAALLAGCQPVTVGGGTSPAQPVTATNASDKAPTEQSGVAPSFAQFTDLPMPENSRMDLENTWVLGSEENWTGRLVLAAGSNPILMYDFYQREMPKFGWAKVTTVRGNMITLVYDRESRVATIRISPNGSSASVVDVLIAPKG